MVRRFAIIANGVVTNVVAADSGFASSQGWISAPDGCERGWLYDGTDFASVPKITPVPAAVTRFQFIQAVEATGRMDDLLTYIDGLSGLAKQYWLNVQELNRDDQEIDDARVELSVSQGAIDTVFRNALQYKR